jgi:hypothetical protein
MAPLIALAIHAGFPLITSALQHKLGDTNGTLAADVLAAIAGRAGVKPEELDQLVQDNSPKVIDAMREVERMTPELIGLYTKGLEGQFALLQAEMAEGGWKSAWRPAGMWLILFLWAYQIVLLHVANAIFKIALPPCDWQYLVTFTGMYMGLYMGGHTIKDVVANLSGVRK